MVADDATGASKRSSQYDDVAPVGSMVFQRSDPEEQKTRRAMVSELVRRTSESSFGSTTQKKSRLGPCDQTRSYLTIPKGGSLRFSSSFEGGNLLSARLLRVAPCPETSQLLHEYELLVDNDTQAKKHYGQWFYFSVDAGAQVGRAVFRIANLAKRRSLHQQGLHPYTYSVRGRRHWEPFSCHSVEYVENEPGCKRRSKGVLSTLTFSYTFKHRNDRVFFCAYPPYTYSDLRSFLSELVSHPYTRVHHKCTDLCRTVGQLPVPILEISQAINSEWDASPRAMNSQQERHEERDKFVKPTVVVISRQHPGEPVGSWAVQGLIRFLLGPSPWARRLREMYIFHIVPMVNVDGVVHGNSRCTLTGSDPNRVWQDPNPILHPVIHAIKSHLKGIVQGKSESSQSQLAFFLDMHGHSRDQGAFFYGCGTGLSVDNCLFPKLCSLVSTDICWAKCCWWCPKSHFGTARYVVHSEFDVRDSFTLECSLFCPALDGESETEKDEIRVLPETATFTPSRVQWIGVTIGCVFFKFFKLSVDPTRYRRFQVLGGCDQQACCAAAPCGELHTNVDTSCKAILLRRPWITFSVLDSISVREVIGKLSEDHGGLVPQDAACGSDSDDCSAEPARTTRRPGNGTPRCDMRGSRRRLARSVDGSVVQAHGAKTSNTPYEAPRSARSLLSRPRSSPGIQGLRGQYDKNMKTLSGKNISLEILQSRLPESQKIVHTSQMNHQIDKATVNQVRGHLNLRLKFRSKSATIR